MENDPASRSVSDLSLAAGTPVSSEQADCGQASATNAEENWEPFSTTHDEEIIARDRGNAFHRLPAEVIEQILYLTDANTFASLVLLNREWRNTSQTPHLYAHHLSRCPSYALNNNVISGPFTTDDLACLRGRFALEVKRNLFEAYLRPQETFISIISASANSSTAFPRGEAFRFTFSPNGQLLLALGSSRIFLIDVTSSTVVVKRELKTLRRPLSAAILDDGSLLAVLSSQHQANIYALNPNVTHVQVLAFDNPTRTITISPEGTVLAAAYDGGVEVYSMAANALSTERRAVRCETIDSLSFSPDGAMLVGSTTNLPHAGVVIINCPYYTENDPDTTPRDLQSRMWTTQILFPNNCGDYSHAALLPSHNEGDGSWIFAYDQSFATFRAVQVGDMRTGVAYFLGPKGSNRQSKIVPCTIPAANGKGELVAAAFAGAGIWLYGIPQRIDSAPDMSHVVNRDGRSGQSSALTSATGNRESLAAYSPPPSTTGEGIEESLLLNRVDWRHSLFVKGHHITSLSGATAVQWVENSQLKRLDMKGKERLVVVARGGVSGFSEEMGEEDRPVDGGRIVVLDFDRSTQNGRRSDITLEVGEIDAELLPEQSRSLDVEVGLVRRRTLLQSRALSETRPISFGCSATTASPHFRPNAEGDVESRHSTTAPSSPSDGLSFNDIQALEGPYSHTQPRSRDTLHRAATAAAANRQRNPPPGRAAGHVVYRRADGRGELPHESDADNWVPPPPPYTADADVPLPEHLRRTLLLRHTEPLHRVTEAPRQPQRASPRLEDIAQGSVHRTMTTIERVGSVTRNRPSLRRGLSDSDVEAAEETRIYQPRPRRASDQSGRWPSRSSSISAFGVAPTVSSQHTIRRRPVSANVTRPADSAASIRGNLTSPISPVPHSLNLVRNKPATIRSPAVAESPSPSTPSPNTPSPSEPRAMTLSGSNLQQRLNYPVPPTPKEIITPPLLPSTSEFRGQSSITALPQIDNDELFLPAAPTATQMANLDRRLFQRRPSPISTSTSSGRANFAVPPSPPRAAWGAAALPSQSFDNMRNNPRSLSRSSSRGSNRSFSASTPNLRPDMRRLDTIQSVASGVLYPERSRSRSQEVGRTGFSGKGAIMSPAVGRRAATDPREAKTKRFRRSDVAGSSDGGNRSQGSDRSGGEEKGKKRGLRCVVM